MLFRSRSLRVTKQKDGRDDLEWGFTLDSVVIGLDSDGDEVTSMVVGVADAPKPPPKDEKTGKRLGAWEQTVLDALRDIPGGATYEELVLAAVNSVAGPGPGETDVRPQNIRRAIKSLSKGANAKLVVEHGKILPLFNE